MDATTHNSTSTEFPPAQKQQSYLDVHTTPVKCPAPAGQTPPVPLAHNGHLSSPHFTPSPVECASPTSGKIYHPATPIPTGAVFHNTPASPIPTFAVSHVPVSAPAPTTTTATAVPDSVSKSAPMQNSPMLCGPTPTSTPVQPSFVPSPQPTHMEFASESYSHSNTNSPATHQPQHLSTIKGNFTSLVGKMTHNPDKQHEGNVMVANRKEEKANILDQKATEWELKGNTNKAQKNREKAARYRQAALAKLNAPLTTPANKTPAKMDKAARLDAKAQEYERKGDEAKAVRTHNKARQIRQKYGLGQPIGNTNTPYTTISAAPTL